MVEEKKAEKEGMVGEFMDFLMKYQVIGLAVAFIIGAAATKMVTACVTDIIMPVIDTREGKGFYDECILKK